jgi:hypothetical protein
MTTLLVTGSNIILQKFNKLLFLRRQAIYIFKVAASIPALEMTIVTVMHFVPKVSLFISTPAVNRILVT